MTVDELRDWLNTLPGDALVTVYADHGSCTMKATTMTVQKVLTDKLKDFMLDTVHLDDQEPGEDYTTVIEIGAP